MTANSHIEAWTSCLGRIKESIPEQDYATWFAGLKAVDLTKDGALTIALPSDFWQNYLDSKYGTLLKKTITTILGKDAKLYYSIQTVAGTKPVKEEASLDESPKNNPVYDPSTIVNPDAVPGIVPEKFDSHLNPEQSFDNYIEGDCNKMACVAAREICKKPGKSEFNPIFIFGGPGLGKTHIANAIGLEVKRRFPQKRVLYVPASTFKMQFQAAAMNNELKEFLPWYSKVDVLIMDDIQDLNSPGAQNSFFTIFNNLHQMGKQLVFTSDRPQVELEQFEDRLLSRFKWGLSVELTKPSYETRLQFLKSWCLRKGISLDDDVLELVAKKVQSNFRDLYCVLNPLLAKSILLGEDVTVDIARKVIEQLIGNNGTSISVDKVIDAVCEETGVTKNELMSTSRKRKIVLSRQIIMYLSRELTSASLESIGKKLGGKDHSTVVHSLNTVADLMKVDREIKSLVSRIQRNLES